MKSRFRRLIAVLICAAIGVSASAPAVFAAEDTAYQGAYYYRPSMSEFDGEVYPAFLEAAAVNENEAVTHSLPEVASGSELPSGAAYQLSTNAFLRGDADGDGKITILDATAIQRWLVGLSAPDGIGQPI